MKVIVCILVAVSLLGCARMEEGEAPEKKSTAQTAIEGATGKTAVDAMKHVRKTTDEAAAKRNADIDAAMGE